MTPAIAVTIRFSRVTGDVQSFIVHQDDADQFPEIVTEADSPARFKELMCMYVSPRRPMGLSTSVCCVSE